MRHGQIGLQSGKLTIWCVHCEQWIAIANFYENRSIYISDVERDFNDHVIECDD